MMLCELYSAYRLWQPICKVQYTLCLYVQVIHSFVISAAELRGLCGLPMPDHESLSALISWFIPILVRLLVGMHSGRPHDVDIAVMMKCLCATYIVTVHVRHVQISCHCTCVMIMCWMYYDSARAIPSLSVSTWSDARGWYLLYVLYCTCCIYYCFV